METTFSTDPNVTTSNKKPFDPSEIRRAYTAAQWQMKEDWYTDRVNAIQIPPDPSIMDIQDIASRIDALLTAARLDYAYVSQGFDRYSMHLKIEEKRLFVELKLNPPQGYQGLKFTVDEMKGVVASVLKKDKWNNTNYTLYQLVEESSQRNIFMDAVIRSLQDKKDLLITHSSMLKIENSLSGMSSSVPGGNGKAKGSVPNGEI